MDELDFLEIPWEAITGDRANVFKIELIRELSDSHILFGKTATALANRIDNDDVIFWINELNNMLLST
ncbi:hypothetical protein [Brevibacillus choshinensis]|uniref:hypothetical protein n=1 Tax=Brevibacillus choshinensis TaxID=54911 RepID=UPI0006EBF2AB|nr:hypothetical protein [Brevibacillus choshinensis]